MNLTDLNELQHYLSNLSPNALQQIIIFLMLDKDGLSRDFITKQVDEFSRMYGWKQ